MQIVVVGVSHRSCPIEVRERLAFREEQLAAAYAALRRTEIAESLILSTCNRVEIYAGVAEPPAVDRLSTFLGAHGGVDDQLLRPQLYHYHEPDSVRHLFQVASGLDSMVLGETDILHQVKHSYDQAQRHGSAGKAIHGLFQRALNAGKEVQARTGLGRGSVSVGTVAIEFAQKIFGNLRSYHVVLVGAGKIGELVVKRLAERGVSHPVILNRSLERAEHLASLYGGRAGSLETLAARLLDADIVITSTSASEFLIVKPALAGLMAQRRHRPLCVIDLGVPRNIDPAISQLENVYLFDIDDLQGLVSHHHRQREQAVQESHAILARKLEHFFAWRAKAFGEAAWSSALVEAP